MRKVLVMLLCISISQFAWSQDKVLRFMWWGGGDRHESSLRAIKLFEVKNPGIKIKWDYVKSGGNTYTSRLAEEMAAGKEADIMQINWAYISQVSADGKTFADLNKYKFLDLDDFVNESWKSGLSAGKLNALPIAYTARMFIWNKTLWDRAKLPLPKTWDDLIKAGKIFETRLGKGYYPLDAQTYDHLLVSHQYIYQKTGKPWIDPNSPKVMLTPAEALEWVHFHEKLIEEHVIPNRDERLNTGGMVDRGTEQHPSWVNGLWGGALAWTSRFDILTSTPKKGFEFVVGDVTMPAAKNSGVFGRPAMMLAVSKNSRYPEEAAKFVNFLTTDPDAVRILGTDRGIPMSKPQIDWLKNSNKLTKLELSTMNQVQNTKIDYPSPLFENTEMQKWMRLIFQQFIDGEITDQELVKKLTIDTNAKLAQVNANKSAE